MTGDFIFDAVTKTKHEMMKSMAEMMEASTTATVQAANLVKSVEAKLVIALAVNGRMDELETLTTKNARQLKGFDEGLATVLDNFQEQMKLMRSKLYGTLKHITMENTLESEAVSQLRDGHERMALQVDETLHDLSGLVFKRKHLHKESQNVRKAVTIIMDEKVSREEFAAGLEEKVNLNQLQGLLMENAFEVSRKDFNNKLGLCFETFEKRDSAWLGVLKHLMALAGKKAQCLELFALKDCATICLEEIRDQLIRIECHMGDPQVAILRRKLSQNAYCAACLTGAQMEPFDKTFGKPPELPVLALDFTPKEEEEEPTIIRPVDIREQICRRWVGGSHTIITEHVTRKKMSPSQLQEIPTKRMGVTADDGRIYRMEEELEPCLECKVVYDPREPPQPPQPPQHRTSTNNETYNQELASIITIIGSSIMRLK